MRRREFRLFRCIGAIVGRVANKWRERHVELRARERVEVSEIISKYYDLSNFDERTLKDAWQTVAMELDVDARRLRPTDRLAVELDYPRSALFGVEDERAWLLTYIRI